MTLINDSGAIVDPAELAAALDMTPEQIEAEDAQIMSASLEDLLDAISTQVETAEQEELPLDHLEPAMESILNVVSDIQASGAISRSDAQTLRQMTASLESFEGTFDKLPINSFTEMPSKVNFEPAMESMLGNLGRKLIEIIKAIVKWIKDKAKAFVGLFRNNRVKAKQTEEAAKKVSEGLDASAKAQASANWDEIISNYAQSGKNIQDTLDAMKANQSEWDKLRSKLGENNMNSWAKGAGSRASMSKVQLDLPMLATAVAGEGRARNLSVITVSLNTLAFSMQFKGEAPPATAVEQIIRLDKALFEDGHIEKPEVTVGGCAKALRQIVTRLNNEAADIDILTVENPEREVDLIITTFNRAGMSKLADQLVKPLTTVPQNCAAESEKLQREIEADQQKGMAIAQNDPRVLKIRENQEKAKICEDIDAVYRAVMNAYAKVTRIGASLAKNPASVKVA